MSGAPRSEVAETLAAAVYDAALRLLQPFAEVVSEAATMPDWSRRSASERLIELAELCAYQISLLLEERGR